MESTTSAPAMHGPHRPVDNIVGSEIPPAHNPAPQVSTSHTSETSNQSAKKKRRLSKIESTIDALYWEDVRLGGVFDSWGHLVRCVNAKHDEGTVKQQARVLRTYPNKEERYGLIICRTKKKRLQWRAKMRKGKIANGKHEELCECAGCRITLDCGYEIRAKHLSKLKDMPATKTEKILL